MLEPGITAPAFTLPDKDGNMVSLSDFRGKKVVLYFYPRDGTPGCSRQAAAFADLYGEFQKKNAVVIGISQDSEESHQKFAEKNVSRLFSSLIKTVTQQSSMRFGKKRKF